MQTSFKTGDKAVYPGQGVGEVMGIEHTEVAGQRQSFYVLRILENGMRIMIPINKVGSVGLREIISEDDVKQVYAILREKDISVDSTTWNRRYREYMQRSEHRRIRQWKSPQHLAALDGAGGGDHAAHQHRSLHAGAPCVG